MKITHLLGCDPSFKNFGLALMEIASRKFLHLGTYEFEKAKEMILTFKDIYDFVAVLENPNMETNIFGMWPMLQMDIMKFKSGKLPLQSRKTQNGYTASVQSTFSRAMKQAQSVGKNQSAAQEAVKFFDSQGIFNLSIKPSDRQKATIKRNGQTTRKDPRFLKMPTKCNKAQFETFIGGKLTIKGKGTGEHYYDAGTLIYRMTIPQLNMLFKIQNAKNEK